MLGWSKSNLFSSYHIGTKLNYASIYIESNKIKKLKKYIFVPLPPLHQKSMKSIFFRKNPINTYIYILL